MSAPRPGFIHPSAVIGEPPEWRDWTELTTIFAPDIASTAQVNAFVTIDAGIRNPTRIGEGTFLMAHVHIGHDCVLGADCELAAGVVLAGMVTVGDRVHLGVGACVRPEITIGHDVRIGAGAVVVADVPAGETWAGNPAKPLKSPWPGEGEIDKVHMAYERSLLLPEGQSELEQRQRAARRGWMGDLSHP